MLEVIIGALVALAIGLPFAIAYDKAKKEMAADAEKKETK